MQQPESRDADLHRSPTSDLGSPGSFQPEPKLREKIEKLAKWRIDPSLIEFPGDAFELHGGHATVSRALLNVQPNRSTNTDQPGGRTSAGQKVVAVKKLKIPASENLERLLGVGICILQSLAAVGTNVLFKLTLREAGFLVELSHPHIVGLEGFVEEVSEGIIWLVFPWEANGNLRDFIASRDWEIPERILLIRDVTAGVEYLHGQNPPVCHGDLKSVNILVNSNCRALITDFGSARRLKEGDLGAETEHVGSERQPATRLEATFCASTNTITLTGNEFTLRWAAPELLNDEPPTLKIDIWALGWIAYEVMTNAIPFQDVVKDSIVIKRVTQGHLPSITGDARMSLMRRLCCLMSECWSADPGQRPTAMSCRKSFDWMPMIVPNPNRATSAMGPEVHPPALLVELGNMHQQQGDYANASKFYTEALGIFTETADRAGRADVLWRLAGVLQYQGKSEEAVALYSDAQEIFTSIGDRALEARVLFGLAQVYKTQGKYSEATTFYSDALKINTNINDSHGKSLALFGLAEVHRLRREYSKAVTFYSDALQIFTETGNRQGRASNLWGLAQVHLLQRQYNQAIMFYSDALQIYTDIGDSRGRAFGLLGLADVSRDQGRHDDAIDLYEQAAAIFERIGNAGSGAKALRNAAESRRLLAMELTEEAACSSDMDATNVTRTAMRCWQLQKSIEFPEGAAELQGGHATVSRAFLNPSNTSDRTDESDGRSPAGQKVVAVKKLKIPADGNLERLLGLAFREAGFLVKLSHRNIVGLEGFVEDVSEGIIWLVFPWEANGNLRDFIASQDWEIPERIWLIANVAGGVEYLHSQNPPICHGDLNSYLDLHINILVNSNCRALITDFGSARRITEGDLDAEREQVETEQQPAARLEATFCASTNTITLTGNEFTLRWAAPELLNDEPPTVKVDIWALGWIAYEVMTNAIPFQDVVKDSIVIKRVTQGHLPSITGDARMSLMLKLCCLMSECWSTDPSRRPTAVECEKSLDWMPMIAPNRATATMVPEVRSPALLLELGDMQQSQCDYPNASKFINQALAIFTETADRKGRARALESLGEVHRLQGKAEEAVAFYSDALEILTDIDDKHVKADALWGLAYVYQTQHKYSEAASFYSDALKINTDINNSGGKARALFGLAEVHRLRKEYSQAVPFYSDALLIRTDIGDRHGRASVMWALAEAHRLQKEYSDAIAFYSDALQIYTDIGSSRGRAFALLGLADVNSSQGRHNDAIDLYEQAAQLFEQVGYASQATVTLERAADVRRRVELGAAA
ncbi:hypothetical protein M407DRAFT_17982 [Tulasnella calospora MUT 4182]|uniref:Protein kinase domain-containing protein n=1 Tax=Tulasnella calospora MUT 4182 TaxID=1051891 RepID=A0A0C3MHD1_9AGAM|nr:hypothetical protein M407DRAFT_17982 [Tulasnella calospora MUT 4182]